MRKRLQISESEKTRIRKLHEGKFALGSMIFQDDPKPDKKDFKVYPDPNLVHDLSDKERKELEKKYKEFDKFVSQARKNFRPGHDKDFETEYPVDTNVPDPFVADREYKDIT
jgi:hypothetical protein|tara:strand:- start:5071 stop:5406 length:336 start_codon:yes stop_codon:yes gene_type:complete